MILGKLHRYFNRVFYSASSKQRLRSVMINLSSEVRGKNCFVLGSSPVPSIERFNDGMPLICINGSPMIAKELEMPPPTITVVDFELLDVNVNRLKPVRSVIIENELLSNLDLGVIVSSQSNASPGGNPDELKGIYSNFISLYKSDCRTIIHQATGVGNLENDVHGLLSRGAFAIGLCAWLGASSITFSGFSLKRESKNKSSYYYGDVVNDVLVRNEEFKSIQGWDTMAHSMADCQLLGQLSLNGHKIYSNSEEFIPLLQNWGHTPPDWAQRS